MDIIQYTVLGQYIYVYDFVLIGNNRYILTSHHNGESYEIYYTGVTTYERIGYNITRLLDGITYTITHRQDVFISLEEVYSPLNSISYYYIDYPDYVFSIINLVGASIPVSRLDSAFNNLLFAAQCFYNYINGN